MTEHAEQVALTKWLDGKGIPYFSVPNAGKRSYRTANYFRAEGMKRGAPDIVILRPVEDGAGGYATLFIEMKSKDGRLSPEQRDMHDVIRAEGNMVLVCRGCEDAVRQLVGLGL